MILSLGGKKPRLAADAFAAPTAALVGDVALAEQANVWYGAVLRADTGRIRVGRGTNIQDNAVLHTGPDLDIVLGENVSVGHGAIVHGCTVADGALIGMHATLMNGCRVGKGCIIAAGALVPQGMEIPDGMLAMGVPARIRGPVTPEQAQDSLDNAAHYRDQAARHAAALDRQAEALHLLQL